MKYTPLPPGITSPENPPWLSGKKGMYVWIPGAGGGGGGEGGARDLKWYFLLRIVILQKKDASRPCIVACVICFPNFLGEVRDPVIKRK